MRLRRPSRIILIAFAVILPASPAWADPLYNATALTATAMDPAVVEGLSNNGQVLLWNIFAPAGAPTYLLYNTQAGGTVTARAAARDNVPQADAYAPQHISGNGQIVGYMGSQPVLINGGHVTNLPGWGQAVNDSGQVAYQTGPISGIQNSFIYSNGTNTSLGTVPGYEGTYVSGINNSGQVAAAVTHDLTGGGTFQSQPAFYNGQTLVPLGTFGGTYGNAVAINNKGDVVGYATNAENALVGFVSHNGGPLISLGTLPGGVNVMPTSINDSGQIVGYTGAQGTGAFLYQNGVLTNLNSLLSPSASNISLLNAYAINNAGQIVAEGILKGSIWAQPQLFLLTPQGQPVPASPDPLIPSVLSAPEPSTLAIFGLMLAGMVAQGWRRRPADPQRDPSPASRP